MARRLLGLLLIIRGLTPFLSIWVIWLAGTLVIGDVEAAVKEPVQNIQAAIDDVRSEVAALSAKIKDVKNQVDVVVSQVRSFIETAKATVEGVVQTARNLLNPLKDILSGFLNEVNQFRNGAQSFINEATSWVTDIANIGCPTLYDCITLPSLTIPSLTFPILPDVQPLVDTLSRALAPLGDIFGAFDPVVRGIQDLVSTLQNMPPKFEQLLADGHALVTGLRDVVVKWANTLLIVVVVLFVLALIYFAVPLIDNVRRGWRLLWGEPEGTELAA